MREYKGEDDRFIYRGIVPNDEDMKTRAENAKDGQSAK